MAYGDEMSSQGTGAYLGRPASAAATTQYAPLVRASGSGNSLIAVANAHTEEVSVTIEYRGAPFSPNGADEVFRQNLSVPFHGAVYLDLSERGRGSVPVPDLTRSPEPDGGFVGSAVVRATGPVLAVVQDEQLKAGAVDSLAIYNAFGPRDLGTEFRVASVNKMYGYQSSSVLAYNPGYDSIDVTVELDDDSGAYAGETHSAIPAQSFVRLELADTATFPAGRGTASIHGTGSFAALVYDERDDRGDPLAATTTAYIRSIGTSHVSGSAGIIEQGENLRVDLQISGTWPGATYSAAIAKGDCEATREVVHQLAAPEEGQSTTVLRNLSIDDLTGTPHSVVVNSAAFPGRPPREVACGVIEPLPGADVVDTALSWPVRMVAGAPIASPTPVRRTETPTATSPSMSTATPTATQSGVRYRALLPIAYR